MTPTGPNCCSKCPNGVNCRGATSTKDRYLETLSIENKYYRFSDTSYEIYPCGKYHNFDEHCGGGSNFYGEKSCKHHSTGPLCRLCEDNYFHASREGKCVLCGKKSVLISTIPIIIFGFLLLCLTILYRYDKRCAVAVQRLREWTAKNWAMVTWYIIAGRILVLQFQVVAKFSYMQDVYWPPPFKYLISFLDLVFLDITSWMPGTECVGVNHYRILLFYTLGPFSIFLLLVLGMTWRDLQRHAKEVATSKNEEIEQNGEKEDNRHRNYRNEQKSIISRTFVEASDIFLELLNFVHALICVRIFQTIDCVTFDGGSNGKITVLRIDYQVSCDSDEHARYTAYTYTAVAVYCVIIPIMMLVRKYHQIQPESRATIITMPMKSIYWYFDLVDLMYRLFMTGLLLVLFKSVELRLVACVYISTFQQMLVSYLRPYCNASHNKIAVGGQLIVTLTIMSAYILDWATGHQRIIIGYFLFSSNIFIVVIALYAQRANKIADTVTALMRHEPVDRRLFKELWDGKNKQVLAYFILQSAEACLEFVENNFYPDFFWHYLCNVLLTLEGGEGYVCDHQVPAGTHWLTMIDKIIERRLKEKCREDAKHFDTVAEGILLKRGAVNRAWKKRYVALGELPDGYGFHMFYFTSKDNAASFFRGDVHAKARGGITIGSNIRRMTTKEDDLIFELDDYSGQKVRTWVFKAISRGEFTSYVEVLQSILQKNSTLYRNSSLKLNIRLDFLAFRAHVEAIFGLLLPLSAISSVFDALYRENISERSSSKSEDVKKRSSSLTHDSSIYDEEFAESGGAPPIVISDDLKAQEGMRMMTNPIIWRRLSEYCATNNLMPRDMYLVLDKDGNGSIDIHELASGLDRLAILTEEEKVLCGFTEQARDSLTQFSSSRARSASESYRMKEELQYHEFIAKLESFKERQPSSINTAKFRKAVNTIQAEYRSRSLFYGGDRFSDFTNQSSVDEMSILNDSRSSVISFSSYSSQCNCENFKLDMQSSSHRMCVCGFPREDHSEAALMKAGFSRRLNRREQIPSDISTEENTLTDIPNEGPLQYASITKRGALDESHDGLDNSSLSKNNELIQTFQYNRSSSLNEDVFMNENPMLRVVSSEDDEVVISEKPMRRMVSSTDNDIVFNENPIQRALSSLNHAVVVNVNSMQEHEDATATSPQETVKIETKEGAINSEENDCKQSVETPEAKAVNTIQAEYRLRSLFYGGDRFSDFTNQSSVDGMSVLNDSRSSVINSLEPQDSGLVRLSRMRSFRQRITKKASLLPEFSVCEALNLFDAGTPFGDDAHVPVDMQVANDIQFSSWTRVNESEEEKFIYRSQIEIAMKLLKEKLKYEIHALPPLFAVIQTRGSEAHRLIIEAQKEASDTAMLKEPKAAFELRELNVCLKKRGATQPLPRARISRLLEGFNFGQEFRRMIDERTIPQLMYSLGQAHIDLFRRALLEYVPLAKLKGDKKSKDGRSDSDRHSIPRVDVELLVGPVKSIQRIALKIKRYREHRDKSYPYSQYVLDILRATFICRTTNNLLEAFSYLRSSPVFKIVRFNNNIADGKAPYNLHLNCYFWPKACAEPINVEILFFVKTVHNLQHRQRLAKDLRRIRGVHDVKRLDVEKHTVVDLTQDAKEAVVAVMSSILGN